MNITYNHDFQLRLEDLIRNLSVATVVSCKHHHVRVGLQEFKENVWVYCMAFKHCPFVINSKLLDGDHSKQREHLYNEVITRLREHGVGSFVLTGEEGKPETDVIHLFKYNKDFVSNSESFFILGFPKRDRDEASTFNSYVGHYFSVRGVIYRIACDHGDHFSAVDINTDAPYLINKSEIEGLIVSNPDRLLRPEQPSVVTTRKNIISRISKPY